MKFWTSASLYGDNVYLREYDNGRLITDTFPIKPYLFVEDPVGEYVNLDGIPCSKMGFSGWRDARDFLKQYEGVSNKPVYGLSQFLYTFLNDRYPGEVEYDPSLIRRGSLDIETRADAGFPDVETANKAMTAITLSIRRGGERKIAMFGYGVYRPTHPEVKYYMCEDEKHMLKTFLEVWSDPEWTPEVLTGWHIEGFDIPYMVRRISRVLGPEYVKRLSPFGVVREREITRGQTVGQKTSTQVVYEFIGVSVIDYLQLYKKFSFKNQESYKLDHIAFVELGKRKKDYSQYASLDDFYLKSFQGFMDYNLEDTILVDELDDKMGLIDLVLAFAYDAKVTFNDTMTTTRPWDVIIHNYLLDKGIVVPQSLGSSYNGSIVGGYVKEVNPGMYECVASFDFTSLYPHLIMGWNISPETYIGRVDFNVDESMARGTLIQDILALKPLLDEKDAILAGNGCLFSRKRKGFLAVLMQKMYNDRDEYKKNMKEAKRLFQQTKDPKYKKLASRYHNLQLAKKIQLNSAFGALANEYYRWFANYLAEAITTSGRMATMFTEMGINEYMNKVLGTNTDYVIAADTDSMYLNLGPLVKKACMGRTAPEVIDFMDKACSQKLQGVIKKRCQELTDMVGCPECKLEMKREALADKAIWTAKKKYLMNVWFMEDLRYEKPELKITGIEAVRSSTPMICREKIREAIRIIIEEGQDPLYDFIESYKSDFVGRPFHEVGSPRGVSNLGKYGDAVSIYKKATPIQVRGALLYNHMLRKLNLEHKYQPIHDGDKIKFCYLKMPNPLRENVISIIDTLPLEFGLESFIDYSLQYQKAFVDPIGIICEAIGWGTEKSASLLDLI